MNGLAAVLEHGKHKYDEWNWAKGMDWSRMYGAALRHLTAHMNGENTDQESGLSHLDHAMACIVFLSTYEKCGIGNDDRHPLSKQPTQSAPPQEVSWYDAKIYWRGEATRTVNGVTLRYHPETGYEYKV